MGEWVIIKYHSDQDELFLESGAVIVVRTKVYSDKHDVGSKMDHCYYY